MAIDFPSSPTNGQIFGNYTYDSTIPGWRKSPELAAGMPAGSVIQWAGSIAPANWLLCDGSAVSRTTYASLFAAIGVLYGSGDGTTTFNVPDLRGRVPVGKNSGTFSTLGATGGEEAHLLTGPESGIQAHSHAPSVIVDGYIFKYGNGTAGGFSIGNTGMGGGSPSSTYTGTTGPANATTAHNNLQPYQVLNYIIKTSAGITSGDSELAARVGVVEGQNNATPLSPNYVINGALDYWQRGTSGVVASNTAGYPSADRFKIGAIGASAPALTVAQNSSVPSGIGVPYSASVSWSSSTSTGDIIVLHFIENGKYLFAGKTVTFSFYAKATNAITIGGHFDQDYSPMSFNLSTSWARYSYTISLPSTYQSSPPVGSSSSNHTEVRFIRLTNTNSAANTIFFTGVQVEEGPYATPFRRNSPSLSAELLACQRYYQSWDGTGFICWGSTWSTTGTRVCLPFITQMRAAPSAWGYSSYGDLALEMPGIAFGGAISLIDNFNATPKQALWNVTSGANANFGGAKSVELTGANSSAKLWVSAEL